VNVGVLVHQKSVVEMVGLKTGNEDAFESSDNIPQFTYFFYGQIADVFIVSLQANHALARLVLIVVCYDAPVCEGAYFMAFQGLTQRTVHSVYLFVLSGNVRICLAVAFCTATSGPTIIMPKHSA
jgi:hypothetical protein